MVVLRIGAIITRDGRQHLRKCGPILKKNKKQDKHGGW